MSQLAEIAITVPLGRFGLVRQSLVLLEKYMSAAVSIASHPDVRVLAVIWITKGVVLTIRDH